MTAGFLGFGAGVAAFAASTRGVLPSPARLAAAVAAAGTVGVALTPLDTGVDGLHGVFAFLGYAGMAAIPVASGVSRRAAVVASTVIAAALVASSSSLPTGLFQRLGLTVGDVWIAGTAVVLSRRRPSAPTRSG
jgi:hypothetical protein